MRCALHMGTLELIKEKKENLYELQFFLWKETVTSPWLTVKKECWRQCESLYKVCKHSFVIKHWRQLRYKCITLIVLYIYKNNSNSISPPLISLILTPMYFVLYCTTIEKAFKSNNPIDGSKIMFHCVYHSLMTLAIYIMCTLMPN